MDCKKIKELIATDYIDGEAGSELQAAVKKHISSCSQCRQFEKELRQAAQEPFKAAQQVYPPESVWLGIRETLEKRQAQQGWLRVFIDKLLYPFMVMPRPAFAASMLIIVIVAGTLFTRSIFNSRHELQQHVAEQMMFLSYLQPDASNSNGHIDLGTAIEENFF